MHQTAKFMPCSALALCQEFLFAETIRRPKETDRRVSVCRINMAAKKKPRQDTYSSPSHQTYQHSRQNHRKPARHLHTDAQKHM